MSALAVMTVATGYEQPLTKVAVLMPTSVKIVLLADRGLVDGQLVRWKRNIFTLSNRGDMLSL